MKRYLIKTQMAAKPPLLKNAILNRMTHLGMPDSVKVAG